MRKEVHISPNFFESLNEVYDIMKEILENNKVEKFEVSPNVSAILSNTDGFVAEKEEIHLLNVTKIGKFKDILVYMNGMATTDYIDYQ